MQGSQQDSSASASASISDPMMSTGTNLSMMVWGSGKNGKLGLGGDESNRIYPTVNTTVQYSSWAQVECGKNHSVALNNGGEVFTWGDNKEGQLGYDDIEYSNFPMKVEALKDEIIVKIRCGADFTVAISTNGVVFTWGKNNNGQLGHVPLRRNNEDDDDDDEDDDEDEDEDQEDNAGNEANQQEQGNKPKKVDALDDLVITDVACGENYAVALTSIGSLYTWGIPPCCYNRDGPRLVGGLENVISISAHDSHLACVTGDGDLYTWGEGKRGKLGHNNDSSSRTPTRVEFLVGIGINAQNVACGKDHTVVCTEDGSVYTFGSGEDGQLGHGDTVNKLEPTLVETIDGKNITQVQCGSFHTMALTASGYVYTWGKGWLGLLGHRSGANLTIPCLVEDLRRQNVVQISTYWEHCAALIDPNPSEIRLKQQALINDREHCDVKIKVENEVVCYANAEMLEKRSDFFSAMFRHKMRESLEREIEIEYQSKPAVMQLMEYVHTDANTVNIDYIVELFILADMYQLSGLKMACKGILEKDLTNLNVLQILEEAYTAEEIGHLCYDLKEICLQCVDDNYHFLSENNAFSALRSDLESDIYQRYFFSVEEAENERNVEYRNNEDEEDN